MEGFNEIVQLSYVYFENKVVTPEEIKVFIGRMRAAYPDEDINDEKLFNAIESIHNVTIDGKTLTLDNLEGHEEWFNTSTNLPINRHFEWHFWAHLRMYLLSRKKRPVGIVDKLDELSSMVLARMEDPNREGGWDRRGMVMGSVQSGKTANYTALICKALDAGYKLIIVLAGVHNSLRSQTQDRLNEEILGYDLDRVQRLTGQETRIGVRKIFPVHNTVNTLTSSNQKGDFSRAVANTVGILPSKTGDPIILIVKKNVPILKNLYNWLSSLPGTLHQDGRSMLPDIPLLLIDDECDFASVNTKRPEFDDEGKVIEEWDPAKTNMYIRMILFLFQKSAYVGYTATPYANIFIHKDHYHQKYGDDLFPKHFIISLPQPSNYIGPELVFGITGDEERGINEIKPLPLVKHVSDHVAIIPDNHKNGRVIRMLPGSLITAIKSFLLVCAARRIRKGGIPHNSMLIHVTRFTSIQSQIIELVTQELRTILSRIMSGTSSLHDFEELWKTNFIPTSEAMLSLGFNGFSVISWKEVKKELYAATKLVKVKGINGEIGDVLDYWEADRKTRMRIQKGESVPWGERGISIIAVGGDKLSRGLTLDGLSISYYLRASRMYDTLMQMGRWFGYHDGYIDLCRIYTTEELEEWYKQIALANQELRNDLEYMDAINSTPEEFGLKVRSFPGRLIVTSAGKSRQAEKLSISFAGQFPKTVIFDPRESKNNLEALKTLIDQMGRNGHKEIDPSFPRYHWEDVDPTHVLNFLRKYRTLEDAKKKVDPQLIADFIERQIRNGELSKWHVVIVSNTEKKSIHKYKDGDIVISCVERHPQKVPTPGKISIGTLTSPVDETLDMDEDEYKQTLIFDEINNCQRSDGTPSSKAIRHIRPNTRALMLIYMPAYVDNEDNKNNYGLEGNEIVGFAISFPESKTAVPVDYWVNPVYLEQN